MRVCKRCSKAFDPVKNNQQVCNNPHFSVCKNCGNNFPWSKRKKTCSSKCTAELRKKNLSVIDCAWIECDGTLLDNGRSKYCDKDHLNSCVVCDKSFVLSNMNRISKTCSQSCASSLSHSEESKQVRKENSLKKYGTEFAAQSDLIKEKIKEVLESDPSKDFRIGSENYQKLIKDKFGVENVSSLDGVKQKKVETSLKHYGVENPFQDKGVQEKFKKTVQEKYGHDHPLQVEEIKGKFKDTVDKKYPGKWINQLHVKNFEEYINLKKWAIEFYKDNNKKPMISDAAEYFGVSVVTISVIKNRENLSPYFRIINSKKEEKFQDFLANNLPDLTYRHNDRTSIAPHELDFYFPEHKFAVEISPTSTHHSADLSKYDFRNAFGSKKVKESDYHVKKALACENAGIELFTIFDWMPWEKSLNMILHKLSGSNRRIYARKAKIHFIDKYEKQNKKIARDVKDFINNYHILGFDGRGSQYFTYLEYNGEIIGAAGWGKPRNLSIKNLGKKRDNSVAELTRMCFKPDVSVPGGASRLLKSFIKNFPNDLQSIITFSDFDLGAGDIYKTLGFNVISSPSSQKNFVHPVLNKGEGKNEHSFRIKSTSLHFAGADRLLKSFPGYEEVGMECKCANEFHEKRSCLPNNEEIVLSYGFLPVFDCGYKKWELIIEKD